jgi:hypothetical protein
MQRKMINYEVFEKLQENSLAAAQYELVEAEDVLAHALDSGPLSFHNFTDTHVLYETDKGTYIRANYKVDSKAVALDNIEEIVIDENTYKDVRRGAIRTMLDSILEDNAPKANTLFDEVMDMVREHHKRESAGAMQSKMVEANVFARRDPRHPNKLKVRKGGKNKKMARKRTPAEMRAGWAKRKQRFGQSGTGKKTPYQKSLARKAAKLSGRKPKMLQEWYMLSENVFGYLDFVENNVALTQAAVKTDDKGQVVALRLPSVKARNEGKILNYGLKTMKTDVKVLREAARRLPGNREFCEMIADLKRHNNLSDNEALEESIGGIVTKYPSVLYLTQEELAEAVATALSNLGATNYDDRICGFMAEGILRVAHEAYADRVARIAQLAGKQLCSECDDPYASFAETVREFYPSLDETTALEIKVFEDLYNAAVDVRRAALESDNEDIREEATLFAKELETVLQGEAVPSLELAAEVATWLQDIVETNLDSKTWQVVKTPHETIQGDHPAMWDKAKHGYAPASDFSGDWGDSLPQISGDKVGYKGGAPDETRNRSWGNKGGTEVWPSLTNPYVPKPFGDYTMKGEKGVDKDWNSGIDMWQSGDTWPSLQNPYVPKSVKVHVNSDNRVDDQTN